MLLPALLLLASITGSVPACDGPWWPPLSGQPTRGFQAPDTAFGPGHRGIDLPAAPGDEVRSPADGRVAVAGRIAGRPVLVIEEPSGRRATLEPVVPVVAHGQPVRRGDVIGTVGLGGHCDRQCVHLGARLPAEGQGRGQAPAYADPLELLGCRPVLKPEVSRRSGGGRG
jgi:murein DD-endopeptidase MepM/ murein hydrolase activator NlpD